MYTVVVVEDEKDLNSLIRAYLKLVIKLLAI